MMIIQKNDVVQFTEKHKWCGCLGIVDDYEKLLRGAMRYLVGVPIPNEYGVQNSKAYALDSEITLIGRAALAPKESEDSECDEA